MCWKCNDCGAEWEEYQLCDGYCRACSGNCSEIEDKNEEITTYESKINPIYED